MNNTKKSTGKIYRAYNKITGKSYIGKTVNSLKLRKWYHFYDAKKYNSYHFHRALNKYDVGDWEWSVIEKNVPQEDLNDREVYWVNYYDSYNKGYNSTVGGGGLHGTAKKHKLYHEDHGWVEMTRDEFANTYNLNRGAIGQVITDKRPHHKGWCKSIEVRDKPRKKHKKRIMLNPLKSKLNSFKYEIHTIRYKGEVYKGTKVSLSKLLGVSIERIRQITHITDTSKKNCLLDTVYVEKVYLLPKHRKKSKINYSRHYNNLYNSGEIYF